MPTTPIAQFPEALFSPELLLRMEFDDWTAAPAPWAAAAFSKIAVSERYWRNGFEWDIHGTLYEPAQERFPGIAFVMFHGGAGSEKEVEETPDGRPGLASVLASLGFRCLAVTYPGHIPATGEWREPVATRQPHYLLDQDLTADEIASRHDLCTYNCIVEGAARLTDRLLADHRIIAFGHSTGGPMSISLQQFLRSAEVMGIVGWGSGGPDGWYREWVDLCSGKKDAVAAPQSMARRSVEAFRKAGYEDARDLTPWGGAEEYFAWGDRFKSQMKTGLCDNQHCAHVGTLVETAARTGLSVSEYIDHLRDPDPVWLSKIGVLLLVGENDRNHWLICEHEDRKLEMFMGYKFAQRARNAKVVFVPRFGHFGYVGIHNEKIAYAWVAALLAGFFDGIKRAI